MRLLKPQNTAIDEQRKWVFNQMESGISRAERAGDKRWGSGIDFCFEHWHNWFAPQMGRIVNNL